MSMDTQTTSVHLAVQGELLIAEDIKAAQRDDS